MLTKPVQNMDFETLPLPRDDTAGFVAVSGTLSEATGFALPQLQRALLQHVSGGRQFTVLDAGRPILTTALSKRLLPLPHHVSWETPLSPSGVPAIAAGFEQQAVAGLLMQLRRPVLLHQIPVDGAVFQAFKQTASHFAVVRQWERAGLRVQGSHESWLMTNFDQKRRKELKRLRTRLSEQGALESQSLTSALELPSYVDDFLRLEASGWKGGKGTALQQDANLVAALRTGLKGAFDAGKLKFWRIVFDGRAIASLFAFIEQGQVTLGKIAYDEGFAKFSPGVLIIIDATAAIQDTLDVTVADSTAIPGHPMIDRIWRDRLPMADILVAGSAVSTTYFNIVVRSGEIRNQLRSSVKSIYYKLKGEQAS